MKVLLSWLREFAPELDGDPVELGDKLSALGLAVEEMEEVGTGVDGIVLAKVLDLTPHPDADRIQLVSVDAGDGEALQVCCGAFNMVVGDLIPFAPLGTTMVNGMVIERRKMRGEWSNGMCCSATEIGLGDDADGIFILTGQATDAQLGAPIGEALGVERDTLWDLEVNANRPDALSVAGVARDLAAGLGIPFAFPDFVSPGGSTGLASPTIDIVDPSLCGRFLAQTITGVSVGQSPAWLANRLRALGQRPINSVVDVSNYVMLELGQPNHTYDYDRVPDAHLRIRRANEGESLTTLDGVDRTLVASDGVIANKDDLAIGIAGVMGGASTEISDATTSVLLEMAWWDPPSISRTVKRLQLRSEASQRYQRGADWGENMHRAMRRFAMLVSESNDQAVADATVVDAAGTTPDRSPLRIRTAKVNGLLGTDLSTETMQTHLQSIGFEAAPAGDDLDVVVPTWRWDTVTETDVAEEVARLHGYENIVRTVPKGDDAGGLTPYQQARRHTRDILLGAGCDETQPLPFLAPGDLARCGLPDDGITLANPLVAEESVLRTSLLPGQLKALAYNQSHRNEAVALFEIGHIYLPAAEGADLPDEREHLAVALADAEAPAAVALLELLATSLALPNLQLKTATPPGLHPTRSATVSIAGRERGTVGEVDPDVAAAYGVNGRVAWIELDLGEILNGPHGNRKYSQVSKQPSSDIDLAFVVDEAVPASSVAATIRKSAGKLLVDLSLFDTFRGDALPAGSRSLTYRLRFQAPDRTLTDGEVADARDAIIALAAKNHQATLR